MKVLAGLFVLLSTAALAAEKRIEVPSGQDVTLFEVLEDRDGPAGVTLRYRFVAPLIARASGSISAEVALQDIEALCMEFVLPDAAEAGLGPDQVVISLMDRPVNFGSTAPEATQYFEAYKLEAGKCVWEGF